MEIDYDNIEYNKNGNFIPKRICYDYIGDDTSFIQLYICIVHKNKELLCQFYDCLGVKYKNKNNDIDKDNSYCNYIW